MLAQFNIDYEAVARHVRERFAHATVQETPYPHMQLENVLPEEYYDLLLDALPLPQDLGTDNTGALNFAVIESDPHFARMTPIRRNLWREFDQKISQSVIRSEMIRLFAKFMGMKLNMMLDQGWPQRAEAILGNKLAR